MAFPVLRGYKYESGGTDVLTSRGVTVTADGSAHTKGAYAELVASSGFAAQGIWVTLGFPSGSVAVLLDIAVGAAGSEQVVIPNLYWRPRGTSVYSPFTAFFPIHIPAGTRISARCQASTGSSTLDVAVMLLRGGMGFAPFGSDVIDIGSSSSAASNPGMVGVTTTPANTKTAYTEMTSSLTRAISYLSVILYSQSAAGSVGFLYDVAIGAAASETVVIPNIPDTAGVTTIQNARQLLFPLRLPAGTRIAMRAQGSGTTSLATAGLHGI